MKLKPEVKAELLKRLRSGEIRQGKGALRNADDSMCCLGVLTEMSVEAGATEPGVLVNVLEKYVYPDNGGEASTMPPFSVYKWAFFNYDWPQANTNLWYVLSNGFRSFLPALNDGDVPFTDIADLIEDNL